MEGKNHLHIKIKDASFLIKHEKIKVKLEKLNSLSDIHKLSDIHQLSLTYFGEKLLDPPFNENPDVSFAQHKTTENTTTFLVKLSLKMRRNS